MFKLETERRTHLRSFACQIEVLESHRVDCEVANVKKYTISRLKGINCAGLNIFWLLTIGNALTLFTAILLYLATTVTCSLQENFINKRLTYGWEWTWKFILHLKLFILSCLLFSLYLLSFFLFISWLIPLLFFALFFFFLLPDPDDPVQCLHVLYTN